MSSRSPYPSDYDSPEGEPKRGMLDVLDVALRLFFPLVFALWPFGFIYLRDAYPLADPANSLQRQQMSYMEETITDPAELEIQIETLDAEGAWAPLTPGADNGALAWLYARVGERDPWALIGRVDEVPRTFFLAPGRYQIALTYPLEELMLEAGDADPYPIYPLASEERQITLASGKEAASTFRLAHHAGAVQTVPLKLKDSDERGDPGDLLYGVRHNHVLEATREGLSIILRQPRFTHAAAKRNAPFSAHGACTISWHSDDLEIVTREWTLDQIGILKRWIAQAGAHPCCVFRAGEATAELNRMIETYHASRPGMRWYEWSYGILLTGLFVFWGIRAARNKDTEGFAWIVLAPAIGLQVVVFIVISAIFWITGYNYLYHLYQF